MDNEASSHETINLNKGLRNTSSTNNSGLNPSSNHNEQISHQDQASMNLDDLSAYIKSAESSHRGIPPLEKWQPNRVGAMDLVIKANGEWWHEGVKISRHSLVQLFSTVLWMEGDKNTCQYYLKTPVEKILIEVEDVPFLVNDVNVVVKEDVPWLEFMTSVGDVIYLDNTHPIVMRQYKGEMRPYIKVRLGMYGLIARSVFMHLTQIGTLSKQDDVTILSLQSGGEHYQISVLDENDDK